MSKKARQKKGTKDIEKEKKELLDKMKKEIDPELMKTLDLIVKMNQAAPQRFEVFNSPSGTSPNAQ